MSYTVCIVIEILTLLQATVVAESIVSARALTGDGVDLSAWGMVVLRSIMHSSFNRTPGRSSVGAVGAVGS